MSQSFQQTLPFYAAENHQAGITGMFGQTTGIYAQTVNTQAASGATSIVLNGNTNIAIGQTVSGAGIPAFTTVTALSTNTITISNATTAIIPVNMTLTFTNNTYFASDSNASYVPRLVIGTIARFKETLLGLGEAEFIYMPLNSTITAQGMLCALDQNKGAVAANYASAAIPAVGGTNFGIVGVAMNVWNSNGLAYQFGWFQISGTAIVDVAANTVAAGNRPYATAAAGVLATGGTATYAVDGARFTSAGGATIGTSPIQLTLPSTLALVSLDRPALNGNG